MGARDTGRAVDVRSLSARGRCGVAGADEDCRKGVRTEDPARSFLRYSGLNAVSPAVLARAAVFTFFDAEPLVGIGVVAALDLAFPAFALVSALL